MKTIVSGLCLEVVERQDKKDPSKKYLTLIAYEFGKPYPELVKINVSPERVSQARSLVGGISDITCELFVFKDRTSLNYVQGVTNDKK